MVGLQSAAASTGSGGGGSVVKHTNPSAIPTTTHPRRARAPMPLHSGERSSRGGSNGIRDGAMASLDGRRRQREMPLWGLATGRAPTAATAPRRLCPLRRRRRRYRS